MEKHKKLSLADALASQHAALTALEDVHNLGLSRNKIRVAIMCMAQNIKLDASLQREILQAQESYAY